MDVDDSTSLDSIVRNDDDDAMAYPGGKGRMFQRIISMIPPHEVYIETHLGGGAVLRAKRPALRNIGVEVDASVAQAWRGYPGLEIIAGDAVQFIRSYPFTGVEFLYCDPPYLAATRRRARIYRHEYDIQDHCNLLAELKLLPCPVMLSGYPSALYAQELQGWHRMQFLERTQAGPAIECIWTNYQPPAILHDHTHVGANFRERQSIRRKRERMIAKIMALPLQERGALVAELADREPELLAAALELAR